MDMDIDERSKAKGKQEDEEEQKGKPIVMILVGAPGSGKSTFCENVMRASARPWARICQDTINNGKSGTKQQCLRNAASALKEGKSVFIDRCNLEREQRAEFVKLGGPQVDVHAVVLDRPAQLCISRSVKRTSHEGNLQGGKAAAVVNKMLQKKELPELNEEFSRITVCRTESEVQAAVGTYSKLGPLDTLPPGYFGQKNTDAKVQLGIMKFLKKVEVPSNVGSTVNAGQHSASTQVREQKRPCSKGPERESSSLNTASDEVRESEDVAASSVVLNGSTDDVPTLAFPSISTADFQFNHEKAADIIVENVEEFMNKLGNARLVLVDLSHGSKILSLVKAKAAQKGIDSKRFFTFVGDITRLFSQKGLRCDVIANAANWRLKPGGGGVNAAIFNAAGPALEDATYKEAKSLLPGHAVVVPLPLTSPLYSREGVTHVIHVLGPNMNPNRPNCLNNDYHEGCKILRNTYTSLFEGFVSIVRNRGKLLGNRENMVLESSVSHGHSLGGSKHQSSDGDQKIKRDGDYEFERSKKCKGSEAEVGAHTTNSKAGKVNRNDDEIDRSRGKDWGSWARALHRISMHPERHENEVLEITDDVVVLNDLFPKAQKHLLVLARCKGLDCLADASKEHLTLLMTMHAVGSKWAEKFLTEDPSLIFRLGYHCAPSMRQLHLHVISQDFNSKHLKNKKHWNSFNTAFFRDSVDVIEEIKNHGKATIKDDDSLMSMELRCHRCRSAHPNIPRLKSHISHCRASFAAALLQNGRLLQAPSNNGSNT